MDLNDLRSVVTLVLFLVFLGIVAWAWSARRRAGFDAAAQLPFADEAHEQSQNKGAA
jgi:cytochrome c oxidase cbb3-type subunit 4